MRLTLRTTLTMLGVAALPLAVAGAAAIRLSEDALRDRASELHRAVARATADRVRDAVVARIGSVQHAASSMEFGRLESDATTGALRLIYRQVEGASAVALFDRQSQQVGVTEFLREAVPDDVVIGSRPPLSDDDIAIFGRHMPLATARAVGTATSPPYVGAGGAPRLTVASSGHGGHAVVAQLALDDLQALVSQTRVGPRGRAFVVDREGRVVLDSDSSAVAYRENRSAWAPVQALTSGDGNFGVFEHPTLGPVLGAGVTIGELGWGVVVVEPEDDALAVARALTRGTLVWLLLAALGASLLGWLSARAIVRPVQRLSEGAATIQRGNLSHRVAGADRADELGDLGRAFNAMADEVQRWNRELEARVAERTRELQEAQEMIMRSHKLAAVGELGAGVAHEINNPLTGVLGQVQLLIRRVQDERHLEGLRDIEAHAKRINEVVKNLQQIVRRSRDPRKIRIQLADSVERALTLVSEQLESAGVEVVRDLGEGIPDVEGDPWSLSEALVHLVSNARKAMPDGGTLTIAMSAGAKDVVTLKITDTGVGIPAELHSRIFEPFFTDKSEWESHGIGLSVVHNIIEDHGGRITVDSEVGQGSTFTIRLPASQVRSKP